MAQHPHLTIKASIDQAPTFAAIKNYSLAQQLVIDALYAVVRARDVGSLALRLRAEQRLRAAEDDYRRAGAKLEQLRERGEAEPDLCPDAQDFETEEGYEQAVREWDERQATKRGATCNRPPEGWRCTREVTHEGPCAAVPQGRDEFSPKLDPRVSGGGRVYGGNLGKTESLADELM